MALRVWLPLSGDLKNIGLSGIAVTNNGATVDNNGKIGKCYYFNGSAQYLQLGQSLTDLYTGDFSWALWVKPTDNTRGILISEYASTGASGVALELLANREIRVYWNGTPDWHTGKYIPNNEWSHIAVTRSEDTLDVYVNGVLVATKTATLTPRTSTSKIRIGDDYRGGTAVSFMGYLNDVRIYDHCLSPKEVKEISKGLVLHYKFDDTFVESVENICVNDADYPGMATSLYNAASNKYGYGENTGVYRESLTDGDKKIIKVYCHTSGTSLYPYVNFGDVISPNRTQGDTRVLSFDVFPHTPASPNSCLRIYTYRSDPCDVVLKNTTTGVVVSNANTRYASNLNLLQDQWNHIVIILTASATDSSTKGWSYVPLNAASWTSDGEDYWLFKNVMVTTKDHELPYTPRGTRNSSGAVVDVSGLGNNGTISGTLTLDEETPRYGHSTLFGDSSYVAAGKEAKLTDAITIASWGWRDDWTGDWRIMSCTETGGWTIFPYSNKIQFAIYVNGAYVYVAGPQLSTITPGWHHFVGTFDGSTACLYIDGVLINSGTRAGAIGYNANNGILIGAEATGTLTVPAGSYFKGKISDVRIYATPLSADDIKELYDTAAIIDNQGDLMCFESIEDGTKRRVLKTGIVNSIMFKETKNLFDKSNVAYNSANFDSYAPDAFTMKSYSGKVCPKTSIPIKPNTYYVLSYDETQVTVASNAFNTVFWDISGKTKIAQFTTSANGFVNKRKFKSPDGAYFVSFSNYNTLTDAQQQTLVNCLQLEEGETATEYQEFGIETAAVYDDKVEVSQIHEI